MMLTVMMAVMEMKLVMVAMKIGYKLTDFFDVCSNTKSAGQANIQRTQAQDFWYRASGAS